MGLFQDNIKGDASGKNLESLAKSRQIRQEFISEFGEVPTSILVNNRNDQAIDLSKNQGRDYNAISRKRKKILQNNQNRKSTLGKLVDAVYQMELCLPSLKM